MIDTLKYRSILLNYGVADWIYRALTDPLTSESFKMKAAEFLKQALDDYIAKGGDTTMGT